MSISTQAVTNPTANNAYAQTSAAGTVASSKALGQDDFLKLLVAQLGAQDPLNPQKDTDYLAQLAQFSSLEQAKATQQSLAQLRSDQQLTQAHGLLGRTVQISTDGATTVTGVVEAVRIEGGQPKLSVNGLLYDLDQVTSVSSNPNNSSHLGLLNKSKL